jgi:hypothetical protein
VTLVNEIQLGISTVTQNISEQFGTKFPVPLFQGSPAASTGGSARPGSGPSMLIGKKLRIQEIVLVIIRMMADYPGSDP